MDILSLIFFALLLNALILWVGIRAVLARIRHFQEVVLGCESSMVHYGKSVDDKLQELMLFSDEISRKLDGVQEIRNHLS